MKNRSEDSSTVTGIEVDGYIGDEDKYSRQITDLISTSLGVTATSLVTIKFDMIGDKKVCRIECQKSETPVYCNFKKFGDLNPFKSKSTNSEESIQKRKLECHEYNTNTLTGLIGKIRCKQN